MWRLWGAMFIRWNVFMKQCFVQRDVCSTRRLFNTTFVQHDVCSTRRFWHDVCSTRSFVRRLCMWMMFGQCNFCIMKSKPLFLYRDRADHLQIFLHHLHPILQRQQLEYRIFVIEQSREESFNRGTLLNVGFVEALKTFDDFSCFVFHDVDLLPEDDRYMKISLWDRGKH